MNEEELEKEYREKLDEKLIAYLAKQKDIPLEQAVDLYYRSPMAEMIGEGKYGIQYLDYKVLVEMMLGNEALLYGNAAPDDKT